VPYRGSVKMTMQEITGGLRSMMTYIGATKLKEVPKRTTFVLVGTQRNTVFDG
jgi:GMP reductase